jgi:hypothetical protein
MDPGERARIKDVGSGPAGVMAAYLKDASRDR